MKLCKIEDEADSSCVKFPLTVVGVNVTEPSTRLTAAGGKFIVTEAVLAPEPELD